MYYWLPATATSSARLYWESFRLFLGDVTVEVPAGASIFPKEIIRTPRSWAERVYTDLRYWNELDRGGHFAALERPDVFVEEVRSAFRSFA
jgi:epoxide hydrolase